MVVMYLPIEPSRLLPPPRLRKRRHRGLARRLIAVRGRAALGQAERRSVIEVASQSCDGRIPLGKAECGQLRLARF